MDQWIESIVRARFLVAALGENAAPQWWRSQATSTVGRRMLERLFPRTVLAASLETASRAARIEHDLRIGRIGAFHLFRLPIADEAAIRDLLRESRATSILQELAVLSQGEEQLGALHTLCSDAATTGAQGPIRCGTANDIGHSQTLRRICSIYVGGLRAGTPVFPYLEDPRERETAP